MNGLLWVLQGMAALLYGASGVMKVFLFEKVSEGVPSFGALPRRVWTMLGVVEMGCAVLLIVPGVMHWHASLMGWAAVALAVESLVFVGVHVRYREVGTVILSGGLGLVMAFIAYGRVVLVGR